MTNAVRKALTDRWPDTDWTVRSGPYDGGTLIDVTWTDGPTDHAVWRALDPLRSRTNVISVTRMHSVDLRTKVAARVAKDLGLPPIPVMADGLLDWRHPSFGIVIDGGPRIHGDILLAAIYNTDATGGM